VPPAQRAVAPGRLLREELNEAGYRASYLLQAPIARPFVITGPYAVSERMHGDIRLRTWFTPQLAELAPAYLEKVEQYIDLYEEWIGEYPYPAFHVVAAPLPVGLGLPGLTYIGSDVLRLPFIRETSLGHEVLHNWWGNAVQVDYASGNWAEGLTTFMADYTYAEQAGAEQAREMRLRWLQAYAALPSERDHALRAFTARTHDAAQVIGYNKAAMLFLMLRDEIGEQAFDNGVRRFWERHRFERAGWADLQAAFEKAAATDLSAFFAQWLYRVGAPTLTLADAQATRASVRFTLQQTQDAAPYALSVPVAVTTASGEQGFRVALREHRQSFTLQLPEPPLALRIDPEFRLFRQLAQEEAPPILRDVTLNPQTRVIVLAGGEAAAGAHDLARRMLDATPRFAESVAAAPADAPLLLIGLAERVEAAAREAGIGAIPESLAGRGSARVWASRRPAGGSVVAVQADDDAALAALTRPLPHYGAQSFLIFEGRQAIARGVWPAHGGPLAVEFGAPDN
jgi:aminopeptidase N